MTDPIAIIIVTALVIIAAWCFARHFGRERKRPPIPDYEIALTGDRRTADVSNVIDIFGTHRKAQ